MTRTRAQLPILAILTLVVVVLIATAGGRSKTTAQTAGTASSAISLKQTPVGRVLVDATGRTLYLFAGDARNLSRLSPAGRAIWPPFISGSAPAATGGALAAQIGTVPGGRGPRQITYNGHPLYYYVGDHGPGQIAGQGLNEFGARWYVVSPVGRAIISRSGSKSHGGSASSGAGATGGGGSTYTY